jgi:crotonobetainyl-CoA:carnitine CoA-transferase CaiB-like acyl-CoA transferase
METQSKNLSRALDGLTVLDLTRVVAGPWATQILADLGANVIKIEKPHIGDETRAWGPSSFTPDDGSRSDSTYFLSVNRGKRSVTVDLSHPQGAHLIQELARTADILVENYKVGGLRQYGLDYGALSVVNPRLIFCSITGFGQTGPYAARAGYDFLVQGMAGIMSVTGEQDGLPGGGPQKVGIPISDIATGLYAVNAILAAVHQRTSTGLGQHIDLSLMDVGVALMSPQAIHHFTTGAVPQRAGNSHNSIAPYQTLRSADGHIILAVANDGQFARLSRQLGHREWADDERFSSNVSRVRHAQALTSLLESQTEQYSTAQLVSMLETVSVPCGYVNDLAGTFEDPHVRERQLRRTAGTQGIPTVASPFRMSRSPVSYEGAPPTLGQHTNEVLSEVLGLTASAISDLRDARAI